jgi:hypothetical protein
MTNPLLPPPKSRAKHAVLLGFGLLLLLIALGFNGGWLAWHSNARPVGKLRPTDLIHSTTSSPQPSSGIPTPDATFVPIDDDHPSIPSTSKPGSEGNGSSSTVPRRQSDHDHDHDADD